MLRKIERENNALQDDMEFGKNFRKLDKALSEGNEAEAKSSFNELEKILEERFRGQAELKKSVLARFMDEKDATNNLRISNPQASRKIMDLITSK